MKKRSRVIPTPIRRAVLERDGNKCVDCGVGLIVPPRTWSNQKTINLQLHHIVEFENGGEHTVENLVTLCTKCHKTRDNEFHVKAAAKTLQRKMAAFEARDMITLKTARELLGVSYTRFHGIICKHNLEVKTDPSFDRAKFVSKSEVLKLKETFEKAA